MTETSLALPSPILTAIERAVHNDPALKSQHSIRQYKSSLFQFEAWRQGRELTKSLVEAYAADLQRQKYAPRSINQRLAAIRWWASRILDAAEDHLPDTPEARRTIKRAARVLTVEGVKGKRPPRGRYLTHLEQEGILQACYADPTPAGVRDAAMFAVALSLGLRRDDLTTLTLDAIRNNTGESCDLVVKGKGDRVDTLYLYNGGYKLLAAWLALRGLDPGHLFVPVRKNDKLNTRGKLSGESLRKILDARQLGLGLPEHITWHDLRKTFICTMLDKGHDLSTVQKLARHASPETTSNIYDIRGEQVQRAAVQTLEIGVPK